MKKSTVVLLISAFVFILGMFRLHVMEDSLYNTLVGSIDVGVAMVGALISILGEWIEDLKEADK